MATTENPSLKPKQDDFLTVIRRQQLGKLKFYLGACAGVGKTHKMLIEGNRLRRQGVDVVIGYVEPHDRPETTAQIGDLEIVPPLVAKHHGITLKEMDLDAVIARKPTVASSTSWPISGSSNQGVRHNTRRVRTPQPRNHFGSLADRFMTT